MLTIRTGLAVLILLLQLGSVVYARFVPAKYFCWAPYDAISIYQLDVLIGENPLSAEEISKRYRSLHRYGRDNRNIQHVKDIIMQYESTYGYGDDAHVELRYRVNGGEDQLWKWPA